MAEIFNFLQIEKRCLEYNRKALPLICRRAN